METAWTLELPGYCAKYSFLTEPKGLTMREVERIFQFDPEPPVRGNLNDYILETVQSRDLRWFSFFLHNYENRLNGRVRRFLLRELCACHAGLSPGVQSNTRGGFSDLCPSFYRECSFDLSDAGGGRFL